MRRKNTWETIPPSQIHPEDRRAYLEAMALSAQLRSTIWTIILTRVVIGVTVLGVAFLGCEIAALYHVGPLWWWVR